MKTTYKVTLATVLGLGIAAVTLPLGALAQGQGMRGDRHDERYGEGYGGMGGFMRGDGEGFDFGALDTDSDGRITEAEVAARRANAIKGLDADGDGLLSADEIAAFQLRKAEERAKQRAGRMIEALDSDSDGKISAAEMMMAHAGGFSRMFERLDADKDGAITESEIAQRRAAHQQWREEHRGDRGLWRDRMDDHGPGHHGEYGDGETEGATPDAGR